MTNQLQRVWAVDAATPPKELRGSSERRRNGGVKDFTIANQSAVQYIQQLDSGLAA